MREERICEKRIARQTLNATPTNKHYLCYIKTKLERRVRDMVRYGEKEEADDKSARTKPFPKESNFQIKTIS